MADPMTALSVAAATVQFVDFSFEIISLCREIQKSTKNATEANADIESSVEKLQGYQKRLKPFAPGQGISRKDVDTIEAARQDCNDVASKILKVLQDLKPKKRRWYGDFSAAWRAHRAEDEIQSLERRLEGRSARFREALTDVTRKRVFHTLEEQSDLMRNTLLPEVKQMKAENAAADSTTHDKLDEQDDLIRNKLVTGVEQVHIDSKAAHSITHDKLEEARLTADQKDFLSKLSFTGMYERHESIKPPATGTYEWLFNDTSSRSGDSSTQRMLRGKFMRWLISDEKVFWVSGKAGSGKSSLMSFVESHRRLSEGLKQWARGRQLTVLNFFFWRPGVDLQKTIPGLLRSLLHQLLVRKPSAIDEICAREPSLRYSDWTEERLLRNFSEILDLYQRADGCVFFLIDGLDEFEGNYSDLLETILTAELRSNTKLCLSSRPADTLRQRLQAYSSIRLEDLNYRDIKKFVTEKMTAMNYPHTSHMAEIPIRAEGVFLWAVLVTENLIRGHNEEGHTFATLQKMLNDLPQGLEPLFDSLFSRVDKRSRDFLLFIFQMLKDTDSLEKVNITLITACLHHRDASTLSEFLQHCQRVQRQIALRSKGLLEIHERIAADAARGWALKDPSTHLPRQEAVEDDLIQPWMMHRWSEVRWLHRSAYDYIFHCPAAELPSWIREVNITQDILDGSMWLFRYGLLLYKIDRDEGPLQSHVAMLTNVVLAQKDQNSNGVYQTLDGFCGLLDSYLVHNSRLGLDVQTNLGCAKDVSRSLLAGPSIAFWGALIDIAFYDYILSRFHLLKRGRFTHSVCPRMFSCAVGDLQIMRLVLDVLIEKAKVQTSNVSQQTETTQKYRHASFVGTATFASWLTHRECNESLMLSDLQDIVWFRVMEELVDVGHLAGDEHYEHALHDIRPEILVADLITVVDHWQLFGGFEETRCQGLPLRIHLSASHALKRISTDIGGTSDIPLRLLGTNKKSRDCLQESTTGLVPRCVFHTDVVTNASLSRFLESQPPTWEPHPVFRGSLEAFLECRETLIRDVREDAANQLNASQQRYLLVLINVLFVHHWQLVDEETRWADRW